MKRNKRPLPIPQYEFPFASAAFNLFSETTLDGQRIAREREEAERARCQAEAAQGALLAPRRAPLKFASPYRLRAGDVVLFENQACPVLRVGDCAAVIAVQSRRRNSLRFSASASASNRNPPWFALVQTLSAESSAVEGQSHETPHSHDRPSPLAHSARRQASPSLACRHCRCRREAARCGLQMPELSPGGVAFVQHGARPALVPPHGRAAALTRPRSRGRCSARSNRAEKSEPPGRRQGLTRC